MLKANENRSMNRHRSGPRPAGFTIIEVLIVLSIAGLILTVVLLANPALQRNSRNTQRKQTVGQVLSTIQEYVVNNKNAYPDTPAEFCNFINQEMRGLDPSLASCTPTLVGSSDCVLVAGDKLSVCYHDRGSAHDYMGPLDQINIQHAHWCSHNPANPSEYPITSTGMDTTLTEYAVWTPLEGGGVACASTK